MTVLITLFAMVATPGDPEVSSPCFSNHSILLFVWRLQPPHLSISVDGGFSLEIESSERTVFLFYGGNGQGASEEQLQARMLAIQRSREAFFKRQAFDHRKRVVEEENESHQPTETLESLELER